MKVKWLAVSLAAVLCSVRVWAGEMPEGWALPKTSAELERIKALAGQWASSTKGEQNEQSMPVTVTYEVTAGGSAVVETIDPGTSHEMVSVYHDKNGKLNMTHYCMLGNQPQLEIKNSTAGKIEMGLSAESHALLADQIHMHSLTLEIKGKSLTQRWTAKNPDGKPAEPTVFVLSRVR